MKSVPILMASEFSSNWKSLQANLKQESRKAISDQRRKPHTTRRQQNPNVKRKHAELQGTDRIAPIRPATKRARMGLGGITIESPNDTAPSASLALWAEDNDISPRDLAEAYGAGSEATSVRVTDTHGMNAGLSKEVEIGQYVAMDCEMVGVGREENRLVLARVSIVNYYGIQVYDSFVKPKEKVTDWRTHISGVSPKDMSTARPFDEVRNEIAELLKGRILIGHDIRHDLEVLILVHPREDIRDTSRFSGFRKYNAGKTPGLKKLAKEILGVDIQEGQHSSIEDSQVAMQLFRRHRQAFDAEHLRRFPQQKIVGAGGRTNRKRKSKTKC